MPKRVKSAPDCYPDEVAEEAEEIVRKTVQRAVRIYKMKSNELPMTGFSIRAECNWRANAWSWGGFGYGYSDRFRIAQPWIGIGMRRYVPTKLHAPGGLREYKHVRSDPTIGGFRSIDWRDGLRAVTCHEAAHAAQHFMLRERRYKHRHHARIDYKTAHGRGWQKLYALLRKELGLTLRDLREKGVLIE